ncbi:TonB-dependent receptor [Chromatocurvus halotolerans]|uniref:Outer membrane receptor protein involved in Fe transport n=1 Tax=Chromatocurvus halotolerans TaxID=1132028 RepID=A0A4R2KPG3_9GAMM|nr:TonB-dependent receptor [Chromatocurvus halotolerans]TCO75444.1 outer membrane receptor protein involved in Fe transport [Chromatocurvus halotolerans]
MYQRPTVNRRRLSHAVVSAIAGTMLAGSAQAQLEEVIVTATKRSASTQDIPLSVQALGQQGLEQLGITNFEDYLVQLPGVTAGGSGPGQNTIYIRGLASTTPALTTAGVAGLAPNVAFYLDEQPLAQPGRNLDVYTADINRVEVLSGPQGTLFGASSQAGTVRLITNKPDFSGTYGKVKAGTSFTRGGEMSNNMEGVLNLPVTDKLALRGVVYADSMGGYVDNVAGTQTLRESARFRPEGTVRANGVAVEPRRAGFQSTSDLSNVNFLEADNGTIAEDDYNDTTYSGFRLSATYLINQNWTLQLSHMQQQLDSDGVFYSDPELDDYEVTRFTEDKLSDEFHNTALTLEGRVGELEVLYSGAFTQRDSNQRIDYSDYMFVGQYLPYYICDGSVSYPGDAAPSGTCQPPDLLVTSVTDTTVQTHEIRINTPEANRLRATVGGFYSDLQLDERNDFVYPGSTRVDGFGVQTGFSPNFPFTTGFTSDPGPFPAGTNFRNDVRRTDTQLGVFGEATYDLTPQLALTLGARWYDIEVDLEGSANSSFCNLTGPDVNAFGTDISDLYNGDGQITFRGTCDPAEQITYTMDTIDQAPDQVAAALRSAPDVAATDGVIGKVSLSWRPNADQLWFATISEGFRPGLLNRPGGANGPGDYRVPFALDTDTVTNYEIGWKLDLAQSLRFNGSLFFVEIDDLQTTIFDPSITNLFFSDNAANAEIWGLEGNVTWAPASVPGLTVTGAFSFLDTEITEVLTPTEDVRKGDELAYAPKFQGNLRARYGWDLDNGMRAHVMPHVSYSDTAFTDIISINRMELDSWMMLGVTAGVSTASWTAELFVDNLTDEAAELTGSFVADRERVMLARPLTAGFRVNYDFN